jgi:hypothetical protein
LITDDDLITVLEALEKTLMSAKNFPNSSFVKILISKEAREIISFQSKAWIQ